MVVFNVLANYTYNNLFKDKEMKKENLFEFVKKNIAHGHWVAVEDKEMEWKVFMFIDGDGFIQGTALSGTIEKALELGLNSDPWDEKDLEKYFTTNYKILPQKPKPLKVGDRVEVLEIAGEEFAGHKFEIVEVNDDDHGVYYRDKECYIFKHWEVAPVMEEEVEDTHQELNVKHCEKCGGKGYEAYTKPAKSRFCLDEHIKETCPDCKGTGHVVIN